MRLAASQPAELIDGELRERICHGTDGKRYEKLIGVQTRVVVSEVLDLEMLDRLNDAGRDKQQLLVYARKLLESVHKACRGCAEQRACFAGDYRSVGQLDADCRSTGLLRTGVAAATTGRSAEERPMEFIMSSILRTSSTEPRP